MRHIGHLPGGQARVFSDFLVARGVSNEVERENDGSFAIWIHDEDAVPRAQEFLGRYLADPNAAEFLTAGAEAEKARALHKLEQEAYRKRVRTSRSLFPKIGGYGIGLLTFLLIVVCVIVAVYTQLGTNEESVRTFLITQPDIGGYHLPEIRAGEFWRLFSPIVLHFGPIHLVFNMMWLYQLGSMIEARQSTFKLFALIAVIAAVSNLAQLFIGRGANFGGMSGVVYGLVGYVWIRGRYDRASGLYLDPQSVWMLVLWQVICYLGWVGRVANTAHVVGFFIGIALGGISAFLARRNSTMS